MARAIAVPPDPHPSWMPRLRPGARFGRSCPSRSRAATIEDILRVASRAPSGTNAQPWNVHVLTGAAQRRLSDAILTCTGVQPQFANQKEEYSYYPEKWVEPYLGRRRKVGWDLYALLGIGRADKDRIRAQHGRNYRFFDAPVAQV